jgi:transcriptional regulator
MYNPPAFAKDDPAALLEAVSAHPFATLVVNGAQGPVAAYAPLAAEVDGEGQIVGLVGHVARANPFWQGADQAPVLAIFAGPDGYVSPSFYPSKEEHGRVVPTWNYVRIEARGTLTVERDPARLRAFIDAPTALMEAQRARPWSAADAPEDYLESQLRGIVGVRLSVTEIHGKWKLSQNKSPADQEGVIRGVRADGLTTLAMTMLQSSHVQNGDL